MQLEAESLEASGPRRDEIMERLFMDLQLARFNQLYYQTRANTVKRQIKWSNMIAALSASVAFTSLLRDGGAGMLLKVLMVLAAVSAAIVPVLGLENTFGQLERASMGHAIAKDRIWSLLRDLKLSDIDKTHEAREKEIGAFLDALSVLDEKPHDTVKRTCWEVVERELPADKAWSIV